jgi:hypothetical protein
MTLCPEMPNNLLANPRKSGRREQVWIEVRARTSDIAAASLRSEAGWRGNRHRRLSAAKSGFKRSGYSSLSYSFLSRLGRMARNNVS